MSRHLETTPPVVHTCRHCGRPVLYGLAEGLAVLADPAPVDPASEAVLLAAGRATYTLQRSGLVHRDERRRTDPTLTGPVLAEHRCPRRSP